MSGQAPPPSRTASVAPSNTSGMNAPAASTPGGQGPGNPQNLNQIVSAYDPLGVQLATSFSSPYLSLGALDRRRPGICKHSGKSTFNTLVDWKRHLYGIGQ
nr:hypothetical protein CFP56_38955 [Quercus suber]